MLQWNGGDVACSDLIRLRNCHIPQLIRVNLVTRGRAASRSLGVHRLEAQQSHDPLDPLAVDPKALSNHLGAEERQFDVRVVDRPHQPEVLCRLSEWLVVPTAPRPANNLALPGDAQMLVVGFDT